jgi:hypothetical protein
LNTFKIAREENIMETANNIIVATYLTYVLISVSLTVWVARTLYKRGGIFLIDAFHGNKELADSVNHLLVVGFYLINIGFVSLALKTAAIINTSRAAIELLSDKMGMVLLILGGMHFFNLYVFSRIRRSAQGPRRPLVPTPPVAPDASLRVAIPR